MCVRAPPSTTVRNNRGGKRWDNIVCRAVGADSSSRGGTGASRLLTVLGWRTLPEPATGSRSLWGDIYHDGIRCCRFVVIHSLGFRMDLREEGGGSASNCARNNRRGSLFRWVLVSGREMQKRRNGLKVGAVLFLSCRSIYDRSLHRAHASPAVPVGCSGCPDASVCLKWAANAALPGAVPPSFSVRSS